MPETRVACFFLFACVVFVNYQTNLTDYVL